MSDRAAVGIVLISHSRALAEGAADVAAQVSGADVALVGVGGTEDGRLGTISTRSPAPWRRSPQERGSS